MTSPTKPPHNRKLGLVDSSGAGIRPPIGSYGLALGDEVETDKDYTFSGVLKRSGHSTFRVWFGESKTPDAQDDIIQRIAGRGFLHEWSSTNLLAIDVPEADNAKAFESELWQMQAGSEIIFERGHMHS